MFELLRRGFSVNITIRRLAGDYECTLFIDIRARKTSSIRHYCNCDRQVEKAPINWSSSGTLFSQVVNFVLTSDYSNIMLGYLGKKLGYAGKKKVTCYGNISMKSLSLKLSFLSGPGFVPPTK